MTETMGVAIGIGVTYQINTFYVPKVRSERYGMFLTLN